jgi:hypothetical protein
MRETKIVDLGDKKVTVKELSIKELRSIVREAEEAAKKIEELAKKAEESDSSIDDEENKYSWAFTDVPQSAFTLCTGIDDEGIGEMGQNEVKKVKKVILEINPFLQDMVMRARKLAEEQGLIV